MSTKKQLLLIYLFLTAATLLAFWQVNQCDFVDFDDPSYVTENIPYPAWYYDGGNSLGIHDRLFLKLASRDMDIPHARRRTLWIKAAMASSD